MHSKPLRGVDKPLTASLWPMPLPYHFGRQSSSFDGAELAFRKAINLQVGYLNYLHLNKPSKPPSWICGQCQLSPAQAAVISRLRKLSEAWKHLGVLRADEMGRVAAKQERQEEVLRDLSKIAASSAAEVKKYQRSRSVVQQAKPVNDRGQIIGRLGKGDVCGAQQIIADRVKMEGQPTFDPTPFLDQQSQQLYEDPFSSGISREDCLEPPPKVRVHADMDEKVKLLRLLETTGRLGFCKAGDVVEGFGNGLFCVPKSTKVDRLILDGRPANLLQNPPNRFIMTMASPSAILGIHLKDSEKLLMSGDDLSNFFYTFRVNKLRVARNFLDWKIPIKLAKQFKSFPDELSGEPYVYACLASLAMGDSAACEYAQTSHLAMALQCGALLPEHLLTIHGRTPRCDFLGGIIIDDFCLLEKVAYDAVSGVEAPARRKLMHNMYNQVGLEAHPSKGFEEQEVASFWGADVDGKVGLVRGNIVRAASIVWVTVQIASLGICSVSLLEILAGGYVSLFGFRRRMMSLLDYVYCLQGGRDRRDIVRLPSAAVDELWSLAILCPLAVTDLRAGFCEKVYMVDASNWGDAVVSSDLPSGLRDEIHRHGVSKSCWTRLLSPYKAHLRNKGCLPVEDELPGDEVAYSEHPVWEVAARGLDYQLEWKCRAKAGRHINIGELRAYLKAEVIGAGADGDKRVPIGSDSQVSLGAVCKGRPASSCLNAILRQSLADVLGRGIYSSGGYLRSAHNPADDPTRGVPLRVADVECPSWWLSAAVGEYWDMDDFLLSEFLHPRQLGGYPCLNELMIAKPDNFDSLRLLRNNLRHRAVKDRLRLRAVQKQTACNEVGSCTGERKQCETKDSTLQLPFDKDCLFVLESFGKDQFMIGQDSPWPPTEKGFLNIYSGRRGFAKASLRCGAQWVLTIDIADGPQCDVLKAEVKQKLEYLIRSGCFEHVSAAPICGSFSRAITPAVSSRAHPKGMPGVSKNMVAKFWRLTSILNGWLGSLAFAKV